MVPPRACLDFAARTQESQFHRDIMTEKIWNRERTLRPRLSFINLECHES